MCLSLSNRSPLIEKTGHRGIFGHSMSIVAMCDIQILTGLGILISAYANLCKGISAYHFLVIGHVAWFSNLTHIAGLTVLRRYLFLHPVEKWVRLFLMITLTIMLLVAMGPTVFFDWAQTDGFSSTPGTDAVYWLLVSGIWGTIKLLQARSSAEVEENDWSFGQILPIFLLLGPLVTIFQLFFEHDPELPLPHRTTFYELQDCYPMDAHIHSVDLEDEPMNPASVSDEMFDFRYRLAHSINRNYYDVTTCPWIAPAIVLLGLQVVMVTLMLLIFAVLREGRISAPILFQAYSFVLCVEYPSACFIFIFLSILYEKYAPLGAPKLGYWIVMLVLLGYSLFPVLVIFDIPVRRDHKALGGVLGVGDSVSFKGFMVRGALAVAGVLPLDLIEGYRGKLSMEMGYFGATGFLTQKFYTYYNTSMIAMWASVG
ncbi:hypothetical protein BGZ61DRAFT_558522 [Ilyonectria robusta]|uniref:uncharacterized protein n=1 Tax=Ilyonectria robusta TaxID=1079257 RepID=UPI001E8E9F71|nr:uncharacterized protein BGZ61DRAFT_558522 [Ilyonectria robusta]KAH8667139.1 hypothetical protein BGZ61DRAFT_558522 [Ilyonectria robusta]